VDQQITVDSSDKRPRTIGIIIVAVTFGMFGMWSLFAPLESAALAPGKVMVKGSRKSIEHFEGGIVAELPVRDGDSVVADQLLLLLDDTQPRAQLEIAMGQFYAVKATEARLRAERDDQGSVVYPDLIAASEDPRAMEAKQSQNQVFNARRNGYLGEIDVLNQRISQIGEQVHGIEAVRDGKQKLVRSYAEEITDFTELLEEGFADKQRLRELDRSLARTEGEVAEHISTIAQLGIGIGETRLEILQLQKTFHTSVVDELGQVQIQVYDLEERIRAAADRAERTAIRSPVDGVVVGKTVTTVGEVISPGELLMFIVPQSGELIVEARVTLVDIDRVHQGQDADIRFSAFKSTTTPVIDGTVVSISADALTDEQTGSSYYLARVEVTPTGHEMLHELILVPGMPAEVLINTGSRTLFQYLTQPIRNAFARSLIED
jgi:epimerase transport system membrane fusion protein